MGISGWFGMFISTATVNIPTLVMTLAVADCVHIIAMMRKMMQEGKTKADALTHSISVNYMPILITSVTTAVGFLMMNMSDSPATRLGEFGCSWRNYRLHLVYNAAARTINDITDKD